MKDQKGHGSNSRSGSYPNIDKNLKGPGKHVGYATGAWRITGLGGGRYQAVHQQTGDMIFGNSLGHISSQLTDRANEAASKTSYSGDARGNPSSGLVSNASAARDLASGPKSGAAPVHDSMQAASRAFSDKTAVMRAKNESDQSYIGRRLQENADRSVGMGRNKGESDTSYIRRRISS